MVASLLKQTRKDYLAIATDLAQELIATAPERDRQAQIATWERLWQLVVSMSGEQDRSLYLDESFSQAFQRGLQEGFSQGAQAYVRDVNAVTQWPFALEDITIPVDLWYGSLDTSTVHSPDFGATLADRLPQSTLTVDPNAGGAILWMRSRDILSKLKSRVSQVAISMTEKFYPNRPTNIFPPKK